MKKLLLSAGLICVSVLAQAQCTAVATLNENFDAFVAPTGFPQNCWSSITTGPMVYLTAEAGKTSVTFYSNSAANKEAYLISPELSTIDGKHQLSFDTAIIGAGNVTVQVGTLSNAADATTFVAFGNVITIAAADTHANIVIPASATQKYIALKLISPAVHNAAAIDNIVWDAVPAPACTAVSLLNENFDSMDVPTGFPQNCWNKIVGATQTSAMVYLKKATDNTNVEAIYYSNESITETPYLVSPQLTTFDGAHALTFNAYKTTPGTVTVQPGTLSDPADATTFVAFGDPITLTTVSTTGANTYPNLVFPASATQKYLAFKFTTDAVHNSARLDNIVWDVVPAPVCTAVETLNEDFSTFTISQTAGFPQNCWTASTGSPVMYTDQSVDKSNQYAVYYSLFSPNVAGYIVTPELSTIDGKHELSFDTFKLGMGGTIPAGNITVQAGTLSNAADFTTFLPVGTAYTVTDAPATHNKIAVPASATAKYIAFKITADAEHNAAAIDNVKWTAVTAGLNDVTAKNSFKIYPNPSADKNVTVAFNTADKALVSIYTVTGAKVFETELSNANQNLNLSALSSGMYLVRLTAGSVSATQKLVIQ